MRVPEVQDAIIPLIADYTGVRVIEADQKIEYPDAPHVVFKFTVPYNKSTGRPSVTGSNTPDGYSEVMEEDYNMTVSFTAVSESLDDARQTAMSIRDWFDFNGADDLRAAGIAIVSIGDVQNRDSVIDEESREGFDVILRVHRKLTRVIPWIERVEITQI